MENVSRVATACLWCCLLNRASDLILFRGHDVLYSRLTSLHLHIMCGKSGVWKETCKYPSLRHLLALHVLICICTIWVPHMHMLKAADEGSAFKARRERGEKSESVSRNNKGLAVMSLNFSLCLSTRSFSEWGLPMQLLWAKNMTWQLSRPLWLVPAFKIETAGVI